MKKERRRRRRRRKSKNNRAEAGVAKGNIKYVYDVLFFPFVRMALEVLIFPILRSNAVDVEG